MLDYPPPPMFDICPDDPHSTHFAHPPPTNSHPLAMHPLRRNPYYYAPTPPTSHGVFDAPLGHLGWARPTPDGEDHIAALGHAPGLGAQNLDPFGGPLIKSEDVNAGFIPGIPGKRANGRPAAAPRASSSAVFRQASIPTPPGPTRASSTSAIPTSRSSRASKVASSGGGSGGGVPAYLAPEYTLNPAGPASSSTTSFKCPHEGCEKVYKGKHARSIWRRHLQDKHGIPLAQQPRRTRWDNDANRPKSEEERRARTLDSKRRWARKHRAERNGGERDDSVETSLGGSARDGSVDREPWEMEDDEEDLKDIHADDDAPHLASVPSAAPPSNEPWRSWRGGHQPQVHVDELRRPLVHRDPNSTSYVPEFASYGHSSAAAQAGSPAPYPSMQYQQLYYAPPPPSTQQLQGSAPLAPPHEPEFFHRTTYSPRQSFAAASPRAYGTSAASYYNNPILPPTPAPAATAAPDVAPTQKDAAALVLLNLKSGCSSPSSPMVLRREAADEDESVDPDTSLDSALSFSFEDRPIKRASSSPPSSLRNADSSEILLQRHALKRPPPPLPAMLESYTGLGSKRFRRDDEYGGAFITSLVRTPTPATRRAMVVSSPAQGAGDDDDDDEQRGPDSDDVSRDGKDSEDHQADEDGDPDDDEVRRGSGSPTRAARSRPALALGSSSAGLSNDLSVFAIASSESGGARSDAMPPPHPGSSSSVSSFHLSTPAGPAQGRHSRYDTFTRPFFPSSANSTSDIDRYYSTHLAMSSGQQPGSSSSKQPYHSRAPMGLSSPPGGSYSSYLFSSPAHPGISKQLGLTAQPGPGVLSGASGTPGREAGEGVKGWGLEERTLPGIRELENRLGLGRR